MKKQVLILLVVLSSMNMTAQQYINLYGLQKVPIPTRNKGLQYTVEVGLNHALFPISVDDNATNSPEDKTFMAIGGNFVLTYKLNTKLSIGAGLGMHFIKTACILKEVYDYSKKTETDYGRWGVGGNRKDLFVRGSYRFSNKRFSPMISIDGGLRNYDYDGIPGAYGAYNAGYDLDLPSLTYFIAPAIGFSLRTSNNSYLELKAGYDYTPPIEEQSFDSFYGTRETHFDKANRSSFYINLGFTHTLKWFGTKNPPRHEVNYIYDQQAIDELQAQKSVKTMFEQACGMPDESGQNKYDLLMKVVYADRHNEMGYQAAAYNNIGVMLYNRGDYKNSKVYLEQALRANPQYVEAANNLSIVKRAISEKRWNNVINALTVVGEGATTLGSMLSSQAGNSEDAGIDNESIGSSTSRNGTTSNGKCKRCQGSGVCSPTSGGSRKNACHGSKLCGYCNGTGWIKAGASETICSACNGTKKCKTCNGTGICPVCHGKR